MALFKKTDSMELLRLLESERTALLEGNLAILPGLEAEKDRMIRGLPKRAPELTKILAAFHRNQQLLTAAAKGIRSAQQKLQTIRAPKPAFTTYGPTGTRSDLAQTSSDLNRRA